MRARLASTVRRTQMGRPPIGPVTLRELTLVSGAVCVAYTAVMSVYESRMRRTGGPGIIALELAGDATRASEILESWGPDGQAAASASLRLDFGYMLSYGVWAAAMNEGARRRIVNPRWRAATSYVGPALCTVAVCCDAVEGVALIELLGDDTRRALFARRARRAAVVKFVALTATAVNVSASRIVKQ